jgi:benzoyl-CoA reductase/2-hydroxyglutaryl-CoA dehydratase subunit BcrC/BadD/HgdB
LVWPEIGGSISAGRRAAGERKGTALATSVKKKRTVAKPRAARQPGRKGESRARGLLTKTVRAAARAGARSVRVGGSAPFTGARAPLAGLLAPFTAAAERQIEYVQKAKRKGQPVVAMFCQVTPHEMILAAGGVAVSMGAQPQLSAATEATVPTALCPSVRSGLGAVFGGGNPLFEMADLVVADSSCESKRRMQELLCEHKPVHILTLPVHGAGRREGWYHWRVEVMKLRARLEKQFGVDVSDQRLGEAIRQANHQRTILHSVFELARGNGWILDCEELAGLMPDVPCAPVQTAALERLNRALHRAAGGSARRCRGGQRVLLVGAPLGRGMAAMVDAVHDAGALVVSQNLAQGLSPAIDRVRTGGDPLDAVAEKYLHLPAACTPAGPSHVAMVRRLVEYFRPCAAVVCDLEACGHQAEEMAAIVDYLEGLSSVAVTAIRDDPAAVGGDVLAERMAGLLNRTGRARKRRTA